MSRRLPIRMFWLSLGFFCLTGVVAVGVGLQRDADAVAKHREFEQWYDHFKKENPPRVLAPRPKSYEDLQYPQDWLDVPVVKI